jgi:hypothetical protein
MKNNTLLLLSLLFCTQFAAAMDMDKNPNVIKYKALRKGMKRTGDRQRMYWSLRYAMTTSDTPLKGIAKKKKPAPTPIFIVQNPDV